MDIEIRALGGDDVEIYREIRLRAVQDEPKAFVASFEEESARTVEADRERLAEKAARGDDFVFAALHDGAPVGLLGAVRLDRDRAKGRHKGLIWGVYVAPEARGSGVGKRLMEQAIDALARAGGIEFILLGVGTYNDAARALYKSVGFTVYGLEKNAIKLGDRYIDEELMVRFLR